MHEDEGMIARYNTISFLSDYGHRDEFVGVVRSVLHSISPGTAVIDVTHGIKPHDIRAGGLALARAAQYLCPGVVLAVVDPTVGAKRRGVAVEVGDGMSVLVGPDNGLLAPAVAMVGGATRAFDITNSPARLPSESTSFDDGRDLFAPVAAQLCEGVPIEELGTEINVGLLMPAVVPVSGLEGDVIVAEVLWIDRFGNAQLNIDPDDLPDTRNLRLDVNERTRPLERVAAFEQIAAGSIGLIVDSYGLPALCVDRGSAAAELGVIEGDSVRIMAGDATGGVSTAVTLGSRPAPGGQS